MLICKESQGKQDTHSACRLCFWANDNLSFWLDPLWFGAVLYQVFVHSLVYWSHISLGDFDVTVTTYRHPMKPITSLLWAWWGWSLQLRDLKAFSTDGERAISNAMQVVSDEVIIIQYFWNFKSNLEKTRWIECAKRCANRALRDLFGNPLDFHWYSWRL